MIHISLIYIISIASAVGILLFWRGYRLVDSNVRRSILLYARKRLLYTVIFRRRASSNNINLLSLFSICLTLAANIVACALKVGSRKELAKRCGDLFLVNLVPLMLGGQRSILSNHMFRLQSSEQSLLHCWMGRICVLQGLAHSVINVLSASPTTLQIIVSTITENDYR
jgi:hypothetical protein